MAFFIRMTLPVIHGERQSGNIPIFDPPNKAEGKVFNIVATPVSTHGVNMFVKYNASIEPQAYLYKHSGVGSPPQDNVPPATPMDLQVQ